MVPVVSILLVLVIKLAVWLVGRMAGLLDIVSGTSTAAKMDQSPD